ncbi:hypothetical protein ACFV2U_47535 [Streptomyces sp. NPDC059697]|uniref:hypothetical protein n=1 Tax=Streptomyces sp. NPDC059697 TaxID=3346912 RepID=UPI003682D8A6
MTNSSTTSPPAPCRIPRSTSHRAPPLRTAAECSLGALSVGCFPDGDQEINFPLIGETLSSEDIAFGDAIEQAPTARSWCDTFAACLPLTSWRVTSCTSAVLS